MKYLLKRRQVSDLHLKKLKFNKTVIMAMLSAIAVILMYFDFPIPFLAPGFYKLDFSEIPVS